MNLSPTAMRRIAATFLVCLLIWSRLDAQQAAASASPAATRSVVLRSDARASAASASFVEVGEAAPRPRESLVAGGFQGGLVGIAVGGGIGGLVGATAGGEYAGLVALGLGAVGAYAGASVGIPLGVGHACRRGGQRRCRTGAALLTSLAVGAASAYTILSNDPDRRLPYAWVVPLVQVGTSVAVMRGAGER